MIVIVEVGEIKNSIALQQSVAIPRTQGFLKNQNASLRIRDITTSKIKSKYLFRKEIENI
jgi:hypothetical protein